MSVVRSVVKKCTKLLLFFGSRRTHSDFHKLLNSAVKIKKEKNKPEVTNINKYHSDIKKIIKKNR